MVVEWLYANRCSNMIKLVGTFLHLLIVNTPKKFSEVVFNDPVSWDMVLNTKFLQ